MMWPFKKKPVPPTIAKQIPDTSKFVFEIDRESNVFCQSQLRPGITHDEVLAFANMLYLINKAEFFHVMRHAVANDDNSGSPIILSILDSIQEFNNRPVIEPTEVFRGRDD